MHQPLSRRSLIGLLAAGAAAPLFAAAPRPAPVTMYRSPTCGCCLNWTPHVERALGRPVVVRDVPDVFAVKARLGVPDDLRSCHTAVVDGLVVEGHVPPADILRTLRARAGTKGIAVPGMPMGSPGMEHGDHKEAYETILFDKFGKSRVFASHK